MVTHNLPLPEAAHPRPCAVLTDNRDKRCHNREPAGETAQPGRIFQESFESRSSLPEKVRIGWFTTIWLAYFLREAIRLLRKHTEKTHSRLLVR